MSNDRNQPDKANPIGRSMNSRLVNELVAANEERQKQQDVDQPLEALALVRDAWRENASDIHLDPLEKELLVRLRINGIVYDAVCLDPGAGQLLTNQFKTLAEIGPGATLHAQEGRFTLTLNDEIVDLRVAMVPCIVGEKVAIRLLARRRVMQTVDRLGLEDDDLKNIRAWLEELNGMLLTAGPTGSGKTTTLYALLHQLKLLERNILTIEDPVEYEIAGINQIQVDRDRGLDFAAGTKALLRLDPDFLLVGEIRDAASAQAAVNAALSGKILLSTLHSRDAAGAIGVLRNYGLDSLDLTPNLAMVIAQRLVRTLCPDCRKKRQLNKGDREWIEQCGEKAPSRAWYPVGCSSCHDTGYSGRTGVFEVWRLDEEDYRLILDHADDQSVRVSLRDRGHRSLLHNALKKLRKGDISPKELRTLGAES